MKAYSYLRLSTVEQLKGDGQRRQEQETKRYCAEQNLDLDDIPIADLGLSGWTAENLAKGALGAFLAKVASGKIKTPCALVMENTDRLTRQDVEEATYLMLSMTRLGVEIHCTYDGEIFRRGSFNLEKMIKSLLGFERANQESNLKSGRITESWITKRLNALNTVLTKQCPGWLTVKDDRTGFNIIPERAAVLKEIFALTIKGYSKAKIATILNSRGEPVWGAKKRAGMRWHSSYIQKILEGRAVLGEIQFHRRVDEIRIPEGEPVAGYFPTIITEKVWEKAKASRAARLRHRAVYPDAKAPRNLLQGLVKLNGEKANWVNKGRRKTTDGARHTTKIIEGYWVYYVTKEPTTGKVIHRMRREFAESMVIGRLVEIDTTSLTPPPPINSDEIKISHLRTQKNDLGKRIERMAESIATGSAPAIISKKILEDEATLKQVSKELDSLETVKRSVLTAGDRIPDDIATVRNLALEKEDPQTREALIRHLAEIIASVDLATAPEHLPEWCRAGASTLAKLYSNQAEGQDAAAGWVAITLRDGNRIAGFATGDPGNPKIITVEPKADIPDNILRLYIGAGSVRGEQADPSKP